MQQTGEYMTQHALIIFESILPLIIYVLIGVYVAYRYHFSQKSAKAFNDFAFHVLMSASLFSITYSSELHTEGLARLIVFFILFLAGMCITGSVLAKHIIKNDQKKAASFAVVFWKGNYAMLGIPVAQAFLSADGFEHYVILSVIGSIMTNVLVVPQMSCMLSGGQQKRQPTVITILKNPVILGAAAGLLCRALSFELPGILYIPVKTLADCASPISMIMIGISICLHRGIRSFHLVWISAIGKLILCPVLCTVIGWLIGIRGSQLGALCLITALPSALNCGIIVGAMGGDDGFANEAVLGVTVLSACTLFIVGIMLRTAGWT